MVRLALARIILYFSILAAVGWVLSFLSAFFHTPSLFPFVTSVDSIRGFAHAAGFAAARRCLRFLVDINELHSIVETNGCASVA